MSKSFSGGIHPAYNKAMTAEIPIADMPLPDKVRLPLSQHIGAPCKPLVAKGDTVAMGQKIADSDSFVSAPIHASVAGEVVLVDDQAIEIKTDKEKSRFSGAAQSYNNQGELRQIIREAGIVGLGGATFPTHVKVTPPEGVTIHTFMINGAECEPFLTTDHRVMLEQGQEMIAGSKLLMEACGAEKTIIGIEKNKPDAIEHMSKLIADEPAFTVTGVQVKYPQGWEKQLIKSLVGQEVPDKGLPLDLGIVMNNVATAVAVHRAVEYGEPLLNRVVTVSGSGINKPQNVRAPLGTSVADLVEFCGGLKPEAAKIIDGGPMMGRALSTLDTPITKGTSGILVFNRDEVHLFSEDPCIRCASCVDACPSRLLPNYLALYVKREMLDEAEEINLMSCIECGCCSYVCPSKIPLVHYFQRGKQEINARNRNQ